MQLKKSEKDNSAKNKRVKIILKNTFIKNNSKS